MEGIQRKIALPQTDWRIKCQPLVEKQADTMKENKVAIAL